MAATFELEVATPDQLLVREQVSDAQIPGKFADDPEKPGGYFGVLPEHAPMISELGTGTLSYTVNGKEHSLVVSGGWAEVLPTQTRVLALVAERPDKIDLKRAQEALGRAERRLREAGEWDITRALQAAERARVRVEAASKAKS